MEVVPRLVVWRHVILRTNENPPLKQLWRTRKVFQRFQETESVLHHCSFVVSLIQNGRLCIIGQKLYSLLFSGFPEVSEVVVCISSERFE